MKVGRRHPFSRQMPLEREKTRHIYEAFRNGHDDLFSRHTRSVANDVFNQLSLRIEKEFADMP